MKRQWTDDREIKDTFKFLILRSCQKRCTREIIDSKTNLLQGDVPEVILYPDATWTWIVHGVLSEHWTTEEVQIQDKTVYHRKSILENV